MIRWVINDSPSVYAFLYAREIVETVIRAEAHDAVAKANVRNSATYLQNYGLETIEKKIKALTVLNERVAALGLDRPINVDKYVV